MVLKESYIGSIPSLWYSGLLKRISSKPHTFKALLITCQKRTLFMSQTTSNLNSSNATILAALKNYTAFIKLRFQNIARKSILKNAAVMNLHASLTLISYLRRSNKTRI